MKLRRLEREGAVKLTANPLIIEHLLELGYVEVGEEIVEDTKPATAPVAEEASRDETPEAPKNKTPYDDYTKDELIALLKEKGVEAPAKATKGILIDILKTLEG